jgi:hypothetical protein
LPPLIWGLRADGDVNGDVPARGKHSPVYRNRPNREHQYNWNFEEYGSFGRINMIVILNRPVFSSALKDLPPGGQAPAGWQTEDGPALAFPPIGSNGENQIRAEGATCREA